MSKQYSILIILILGLLFSCKNDIKETYYPDGTLKKVERIRDKVKETIEYDSSGKKNRVIYTKGGKIDSLIGFNDQIKSFKKVRRPNGILQQTYYPNGELESEGEIIRDSLKIGWWAYYDQKGRMKSKREYILLCDDYYLNQSIILDDNQDTIYKKDDFNESIYIKYSIEKLEEKDILNYDISPISYRSKLDLVLLKNGDYCKEGTNVDTVIHLNKRKGELIFKNKKDQYSGFIFDYYIDTTYVSGKMKLNSVSRKMYFGNNSNR